MDKNAELLLAGRTRRWHTIAGLDQDTAAHSWGVAVLMLLNEPNVSFEAIKAALLHDLHEHWSGDTPSPAKDEDTRRSEERIQARIKKHFGINWEMDWADHAMLRKYDAMEALYFIKSEDVAAERRYEAAERLRMAIYGGRQLPLGLGEE
tara:strand:- start:1785 stop:2234 length:450 start_codon:yes stop_codon:yes gene_type:complete